MGKAFDELMKLLDEKGEIPDAEAKKIIEEHGVLSDEEKKQMAAAIKMKKALTEKKDDKKPEAKDGGKADADKKDDKKSDDDVPDEVSMEDYIQALSILDSEDASAEEKAQAEKIKEKFESS